MATPYSGAATGVFTVLNASYTGLENMAVSGPSAGGGFHGVAWLSTTGDGGPGHGTMRRVTVQGAAGSSTDQAGASIKAAGIFDNGYDGLMLDSVFAISNNDGFEFSTSGGGSGSRTRVIGGDYSENAANGFEFLNGATGTSLVGPAIFNNAAAGISLNNTYGFAVHGSHIEGNDPAIKIGETEGTVIEGNVLSQNLNIGTCIVCQSGSGVNNGLVVNGNAFTAVDGGGSPTLTSLVAVISANGKFDGNMVDAFLTTDRTIASGFTLSVGSGSNNVSGLPLGPNAILSGKALTITDIVNDAAHSVVTNLLPYVGLPNGGAPIWRTDQGILTTSEASSANNILALLEGAGGTWSLSHYGVGNIMNGTFGGATTIDGPTNVLGTVSQSGTPVALQGADINSSNQVVETHLSAGLPVNQGGTGSTSAAVGYGSVTTTAATSDSVTIAWPDGGSRTPGHCSLAPTNASAATNIATSFISAKASNAVTLTHTATASMTYDLLCTVN
jgi:hypothetical protein